MAEEEKSNVCTFSFKKRKANVMRRKAAEGDAKSSSEDETVVTRVEKKGAASVLSAKTVSSTFPDQPNTLLMKM